MNNKQNVLARWQYTMGLSFLRFAASGAIPARWFLPALPAENKRSAKTGVLNIEIVSHCWNYAHFLAYQLSSLAKFPPDRANVTMTVFYCEKDPQTVALLDYFADIDVPGVMWNWRALPREQLFRRSIGRNMAARETRADWIWFTDCDLLFRENCLDSLADALQGRRDTLVFPRHERVTPLLPQDNRMLTASNGQAGLFDIDTDQFTVRELTRATGPLQIVHGDVARACGYCDSLGIYQQPVDHWSKAHEDRAFRWLLRTQGTPLDIQGVYRIRHMQKGRYRGNSLSSRVRGAIRRLQSRLRDNFKPD